MKKAIHILIIIFLASCISFGIHFFTQHTIGVRVNEYGIYQKNPLPPSDQIVIVKVDNRSLDALQKTDIRVLNITKSVFATLIERLNALGSRAIGMDIIFTNRSEDESILAKTLAQHSNVVIAAHIGSVNDTEEVLPSSIYSGASWGMINIQRYSNLASRIVPTRGLSGSTFESMSIALYRKYIGDTSPVGIHSTNYYIINPLRKIPLTNQGTILIPFFHLPEGYPSYSLIDVLENNNIPRGAFQNKVVLVGEYGTLIHDAYLSPIYPSIPMHGVEFHANMLDGLITGKFLSEKNTIGFTLLLILISVIVFYRIAIVYHPLYMITTIALLLIGCRYAFAENGAIYDLYLLLLSLSISFIVTIIYQHFIINREKRFIRQAFGHYISPEVVRQLTQNPSELKLGGEKRNITVIFSDIAGFTTLSESLGTEKLFIFISEYFSEMTDILTRQGGTLDKYIGDAVMGFFGAPIATTDGEIRACSTALEMMARCRELMGQWVDQGIPEFSVRIGIHTGEAMVGNIGSRDRFNYTVMGDTVNLASRLEGINKEYETLICVSYSIYEKSSHIYDFRKLDTIRVKGKQEGVEIYELLGYIGSKTPLHHTYETGLGYYAHGEYMRALQILEPIASQDGPSRTLIQRCKELIENHIILEDGIWTMQHK